MNTNSGADDFPIPGFADPQRREKLTSAIPELLTILGKVVEEKHVPGLAFGVVIDGELAYAEGFGLRNVAENAPVASDSVFRIASMTKSFTAMSVIKLRDEGKLNLDAPAQVYVPEQATLRYPTADSAPVTVWQLLTMGGGFPQDDPWGDRQLALPEARFSELLRAGLSFSTAPNSAYEYSNYGYGILGRVVTNVAGAPYQRYVREHILEPLGMASSTFDVHAVAADRLAMGYRFEEDAWIEEPPLADGAFGAMGGLFTTIPDFARYMAFLLSAFPPRDEPETGPIRRSSAREMQQSGRQDKLSSSRLTPESDLVVSNTTYRFGLVSAVDSLFGYTVSHGGGLPGYGTYYRMLPDCDVGVVVFTNRTYTPASTYVNQALTVLKSTGGLSARSLPTARKLLDLRDTLAKLYDQWDDESARNAATDTFFMDMPIEKRREQFEKLRGDFGKCSSVSPVEPENALRGRWSLACEHGRIDMFATLSPTVPPRLQYLTITRAKPLSLKQRQAVFQLLRLIQQWDDARFRRLFAHGARRTEVQKRLEALRAHYGRLRLDDVVENNGEERAVVSLKGDRAIVDAQIVIDPGSGKVREVSFLRPRRAAFMA